MTKKRISLTLEEELLKKADRLVGIAGESRSAVFEQLIEAAVPLLTPKAAVMLVGGREELLLRNFKDRPLIEEQVEALRRAGVKKIVFVGAPLTKLRDFVKKGDVDFLFVEEKGAGTAGALRHVRHIVDNPFFLIYGDNYAEIDYFDLYRFHLSQKAMATVALTTWVEPQKFGVPEIVGSKITKFREKPPKASSHLISAGIFVLEPEVIELVPEGKSSLETAVLPKLASIGQLAGYVFTGRWVDVSASENSSPQSSE